MSRVLCWFRLHRWMELRHFWSQGTGMAQRTFGRRCVRCLREEEAS